MDEARGSCPKDRNLRDPLLLVFLRGMAGDFCEGSPRTNREPPPNPDDWGGGTMPGPPFEDMEKEGEEPGYRFDPCSE